ncbi:MAG: UDP-N-acetylmuramoyl-L-alanyl-D-glutamate--2,6-diaminopimelate ligase [Elusimicrobiota bacterium]
MQALGNLLKKVKTESKFDSRKIVSGLSCDSRLVKPGDIFFAVPGVKDDGVKYISDAVKNGAIAVVAHSSFCGVIPAEVVLVSNVREAMCSVSREFYGITVENNKLAGITGTNGKTTITYLLESIVSSAGLVPGVIGTINYRWKGNVCDSKNTTPESIEFYRIISEMIKAGVNTVIAEVSSHSLDQTRVYNDDFDVSVFTNLTPDHLDYHKDMETYFLAKSVLFKSKGSTPKCRYAVINIDDPYGKRLALIAENNKITLLTYSINNGNAELNVKHVEYGDKNTRFVIVNSITGKEISVDTPLIGQHNVYNILAAWGAGMCLGIEEKKIIDGIKHMTAVPGRLETVDAGQKYSVFVDYAHTPDALENVLGILRKVAKKRIITVFGCGGDRDRTKRPVMGEIAVRLSDYAVVTSDNPRTEDPVKIVVDIEVGIKRSNRTNYIVNIDRENAIAEALSMAKEGDIVLIAGKGHENYQIFKDKRIHFDDREVALKYLRRLI